MERSKRVTYILVLKTGCVGDQEGDRLQQARGEEHDADHADRRAEPCGEPVGDERLDDEPAAE